MAQATIVELVKRRRAQMLIHSYIYYALDDQLIDDHTWQKWADELTELHKSVWKIGFYDREFADWDGTTGYHLPKDEWVVDKAQRLMQYNETIRDKDG